MCHLGLSYHYRVLFFFKSSIGFFTHHSFHTGTHPTFTLLVIAYTPYTHPHPPGPPHTHVPHAYYYSFPINPVYTKSLDPSVLKFSLSIYRHPSICIILFSSRFTTYNKQKLITPVIHFNSRFICCLSDTFYSVVIKPTIYFLPPISFLKVKSGGESVTHTTTVGGTGKWDTVLKRTKDFT